MRYPVSRRDFHGAAGAVAASAALPSPAAAFAAPAVHRRGIARPGAVSASNGLRAVTRAMELIARGTDTLDAAVEGVKIQELDPAALEGIKTPSEVARLVLLYTDHMLLAGEGAKRFALSYGFEEADLEISSVTTTSGLAWKLPGREGDSPIVGGGQYTDNDVGAAGSTGRGEAVYAVNARGDLGAASFYPSRYAAHDGREAALRDTAHLYAQAPS